MSAMRTILFRTQRVAVVLSIVAAACGGPTTVAPGNESPEVAAAVDAHLARARVALDGEDFDKAFAALEAAAALSPHALRIQRDHQRALIRRAAARPATITAELAPRLAYAADVLADEPELAAARLIVEAQLALTRGEGEAATTKLRDAIAKDAKNPYAHLTLASIQRARDDKLGAMASFEAAVKAAPTNVTALNNAGVAYLEMKRTEEALGLFQAAIKVLDNASTRINAADALLTLERKTEALEHVKRAVALAPRAALPLRRLGGLLRDLEQNEEAAGVLAQALAIEADSWTLFTLGVVQQEQKRHAEAAQLLARAVQADPTGFAPVYHLAISLQQLGDQAGFVSALKRYLQNSENAPSEAERRKEVETLLQSNAAPVPTPAPAPLPGTPESPAPR
jgi:tetratricopeptide (TPR) repeat protein